MSKPVLYAPIIIYGSGDLGTKAVISACTRKNVAYEMRDIRHRDVVGELTFLTELKTLGYMTVPQVFNAKELPGNASYIGGATEVLAALDTLPDASVEQRTA